MTPDEIDAARLNAQFERALVITAVIAACGISAFMLVLLLVSPLLALPAAIMTWAVGYGAYRYITRSIPNLQHEQRLRRLAADGGTGQPVHEQAPLTAEEEAQLAALERVWERS